MHLEQGITYDIDYKMDPKPFDVDFDELAEGKDPNWIGWTFPGHPQSLYRASSHFRFYFPVNGPPSPNVTCIWLTPSSPNGSITTETLGSVADTWHRMPENNLPNMRWTNANIISTAHQRSKGLLKDTEIGAWTLSHVYPTLSLSLEIKKLLPPEGVKWLFIRAEAKKIRNGRMDAETLILNPDMELIAITHQIFLVLENIQNSKAKQGKL
ncbi:hypothetical protein ACLMJK_003449 [Lecanora helva]